MSSDAIRLRALETATVNEDEAVRRLLGDLRRARTAAETLDMRRLDAALVEARASADLLERQGSLRTRLTRETARALGLAAGADLITVTRSLGSEAVGLETGARRLHRSLEGLAQESAALGISTRHGQAVAGHLSTFVVRKGCYGPDGGSVRRATGSVRTV